MANEGRVITVRLPLNAALWDKDANGWHADLFLISGVSVERVMMNGSALPEDLWDEEPDNRLIKIMRGNPYPGDCVGYFVIPSQQIGESEYIRISSEIDELRKEVGRLKTKNDELESAKLELEGTKHALAKRVRNWKGGAAVIGAVSPIVLAIIRVLTG